MNSSWESLGAVARRALAEERSHLRHASGLADRLLRTPEGIAHLLPLFDQLAPMGSELFDAPAGCSDPALVAAGVMACEFSAQRAQWQEIVDDALSSAGYQPQWPASDGAATPDGGRAGQRSPHFAALHAEMVEVLSIDPTARW